MKKMFTIAVLSTMVMSLALGSPIARAKEEGASDPAGWLKGKKEGWRDEELPPGLAKKDAKAAEKEARKKTKETEHKAKKNKNEAEKAARKKAKEAEQAAKKKAKRAERETRKKQEEAEAAAEKTKEQTGQQTQQ